METLNFSDWVKQAVKAWFDSGRYLDVDAERFFGDNSTKQYYGRIDEFKLWLEENWGDTDAIDEMKFPKSALYVYCFIDIDGYIEDDPTYFYSYDQFWDDALKGHVAVKDDETLVALP